MIITINGKYIIGAPKYLKNQMICNMHANLSHIPNIKLLLPPLLIIEYELLHFNDVMPNLVSPFSNLHLLLIAIEYKSSADVHISQENVSEHYRKIKYEMMDRTRGYRMSTEEAFLHEMYRTLDYNIAKSINTLSLCCDGCSCVNKLEFNDNILEIWYNLDIRHDLVYKFMSDTDFQKCYNVVDTIDNEISSIISKLYNTGDKIIIMILGIADVNSLISSLHKDIIGVLVYHLIHNVNDVWMNNKMGYSYM